MIYYFLLVGAAFLYSFSFYFNQRVERECNDGINTAILFSTITWVEIFVVLLSIVLIRYNIQFSLYSLMCALIQAFFLILFAFVNLKALSIVDLGTYSLFAMLGGMLVPAVAGVVFFDEALTIGKLLCLLLIFIAMRLDTSTARIDKKSIFYLIAVFLVNGSFGVTSAVHQNYGNHIDTLQYMCIQALIISCFGGIWLLVSKLKNKSLKITKTKKAYPNMLLYGLFFGMAEIILLYAIVHVDASVQFPIITGGTIVFSAIMSLCIEKKKNYKALIPVAIAFLGMLCLLNLAPLNIAI